VTGRPALRLALLIAAGAALIALLASLFLLFQRVPAGWSPPTGFAPAIGPVFLSVFPYPTLALGPVGFRRAAVLLTLGIWVCYALAVWTLGRLQGSERRRALAVVVAGCLLAHLVLLLLPPVFSTDLFRYALFGRMVDTGLDPYVTPARALAADPLFPYSSWAHLRSNYGAALMWISAGLALLGGGSPLLTALLFKGAMAGFNLVACWAVHRLAVENGEGDGGAALVLYAWNPLLLMESAGNGHADAMMLALALVGLLLWSRGRAATGFATLVASVAVKYVTGPLALLVGVKTLAEAERGRRLGTALRLALPAAAVLGALYAPYWRGGAMFASTIEMIVRGRSLLPGREAAPDDTPKLALVIFAVLLVGAVVLAARVARRHAVELAALLITFFLAFGLRLRMPWHFTAPLALMLAAPPTGARSGLRLLMLLLALLAMLLYCVLVPVLSP
jgi:hypothetical protein